MAHVIGDEDGGGGACVVRGLLVYVLRASQALGLAPARMTRAQGGRAGAWSVRTTTRHVLYNYLLFLAIMSYIFVTLKQTLRQEWLTHQYYNFTAVEKCLATIQIVRICSVLLVGMVGVRSRMTAIINSLNAIEKVHLQYKSDQLIKKLERKEKVFLALTLSYAVFGFVHTLIRINMAEGSINKLVSALAFNRMLLFVMLALVEGQFTLAALRVTCALRAVNDAIGGLLYSTDLHNTELTPSYSIPFKSINTAIDSLKIEKQPHDLAPQDPQINVEISKSIRRVTMAYESIRKAVEILNDGFGFTMLIIYSFFLIYMTFAPYFIVIFIIKQNKSTLTLTGKFFEWGLHILFMLWGVQPGHEIEHESQRTRRAVSELFGRAPSSGERAIFQLKLFFKQLELGKPFYAPMGIFTLRRPLVSAIFATTVTITVVLLQIQAQEI